MDFDLEYKLDFILKLFLLFGAYLFVVERPLKLGNSFVPSMIDSISSLFYES